MKFTTATIYKVMTPDTATLESVEAAMQKLPFVTCGPTQERSAGWVPPRGEANGPLVESIGGHWVAKFFTETRKVPASAMQKRVDEKCALVEKHSGRKPGKKEKAEIKDEAKLDLLPMAFTKESSCWVWIDRSSGLIVVDTATQSKADDVVTALVACIEGLSLSLIDTTINPQRAMATWLVEYEAPVDFSIDGECELKACDESKAVVRYKNHTLDTDEVKAHIARGKLPTKLALTYDGRVSFVLSEGGQMRGINMLSVTLETYADQDSGFDADVAITTGELSRAIAGLIEALGGQAQSSLFDAATLPAALENELSINSSKASGILKGIAKRLGAGVTVSINGREIASAGAPA